MTTTPPVASGPFSTAGALYWLLTQNRISWLWIRADLPLLHTLGRARMHLMAEAIRHVDSGKDEDLTGYTEWWFNEELWIPGVFEAIASLWILENKILAGGGK